MWLLAFVYVLANSILRFVHGSYELQVKSGESVVLNCCDLYVEWIGKIHSTCYCQHLCQSHWSPVLALIAPDELKKLDKNTDGFPCCTPTSATDDGVAAGQFPPKTLPDRLSPAPFPALSLPLQRVVADREQKPRLLARSLACARVHQNRQRHHPGQANAEKTLPQLCCVSPFRELRTLRCLHQSQRHEFDL